jgi:hypothetical protein
MGRGVTLPVAVFMVLGYEDIQLRRNIGDDVRIGMFVNRDPGGGVRHEHVTETAGNSTGSSNTPDCGRNIPELYR